MSDAKNICISEGGNALVLTSTDDGRGDMLISLSVIAEGFRGHADGVVVGAAWSDFEKAIVALEKTRKGKAELESLVSGEFELRLHATDSSGHMAVSGSLSYRRSEWPRQRLEFSFPFDPSLLVGLVHSAGEEDFKLISSTVQLWYKDEHGEFVEEPLHQVPERKDGNP